MRFTMATSPNYTGLSGALLLTLLLSLQVNAQNYTDNLQQRIGIDQKLGNQLPLDLPFLDSDGNPVHLGDYFGDKPLILSLVYFDCPMLCTQVINSLLRAMNVLSFGAGTEFDVLTISIDPDETPELANAKKNRISEKLPGS
jgi:protein SCO1/2